MLLGRLNFLVALIFIRMLILFINLIIKQIHLPILDSKKSHVFLTQRLDQFKYTLSQLIMKTLN